MAGLTKDGRFHAGIAAALAVAGLGLIAITAARGISSGLHQQIGPQMMPLAAGAGLVVSGLLLLLQALNGSWRCEASQKEDHAPFSGKALAWVAGGLAVNVAAIGAVGFAPASIALFVAVARAAGSRAWRRDLLCAVVIVVLLELLFGRVLGLRLGSGPLDLFFSEWHPQ